MIGLAGYRSWHDLGDLAFTRFPAVVKKKNGKGNEKEKRKKKKEKKEKEKGDRFIFQRFEK